MLPGLLIMGVVDGAVDGAALGVVDGAAVGLVGLVLGVGGVVLGFVDGSVAALPPGPSEHVDEEPALHGAPSKLLRNGSS